MVIQTDGLTKRFGKITAVDDLSMEVRRGPVYGLPGPNGSGKTTTMGMPLGVLRPTTQESQFVRAEYDAAGELPVLKPQLDLRQVEGAIGAVREAQPLRTVYANP